MEKEKRCPVTVDELKTAMFCDGNEFYFEYNGKRCGVNWEGSASKPTICAWCEPDYMLYKSFDKMIADEIFDGKSLASLLDSDEISFWGFA